MEEGEGGVCEGETRLSAERYSHKLGGSQSCQPKVGGGGKKKKKKTQSGERESVQREEDICCFFSSCLGGWRGEPGWCDLLHHGMQPLYPAEA